MYVLILGSEMATEGHVHVNEAIIQKIRHRTVKIMPHIIGFISIWPHSSSPSVNSELLWQLLTAS
jgi:hypothetical protein